MTPPQRRDPSEPSGRSGGADAPRGSGPSADGLPYGEDEGDTPERRARQEAWRGLDQGSIMSVELVTATLVWFGIGWLLDRLLGTTPWFMFAGALLGNWAGLYLIWVRGQRNEADEIARRDSARSRSQGPNAADGLVAAADPAAPSGPAAAHGPATPDGPPGGSAAVGGSAAQHGPPGGPKTAQPAGADRTKDVTR